MSRHVTAVRIDTPEPVVLVAPDEMAQRNRVASMIQDRMARPATDLDLELWQELKGEIDKQRPKPCS
jgi:hypothetical protein